MNKQEKYQIFPQTFPVLTNEIKEHTRSCIIPSLENSTYFALDSLNSLWQYYVLVFGVL